DRRLLQKIQSIARLVKRKAPFLLRLRAEWPRVCRVRGRKSGPFPQTPRPRKQSANRRAKEPRRDPRHEKVAGRREARGSARWAQAASNVSHATKCPA